EKMASMTEPVAIKSFGYPVANGPERVLVIATRRIGDVLLVTPLIHSLKQAWPESIIDVLVFRNTGAILEGNQDIAKLIEVEAKSGFKHNVKLLRQIYRRYNLAVSSLAGDRPNIYAFLASAKRISLISDQDSNYALKRRMNQGWAMLDDINTHTVEQNLALARVLNIEPVRDVVPPYANMSGKEKNRILGHDRSEKPYAVIHPFPKWPYKQWTTKAWRELIAWIVGRGMAVILTGGPDKVEQAFCEELTAGFEADVNNLAGKLSFGEITNVVSSSAVFIGPDTSVTHLAASTGVPVVAIYGPSNPVKWGPWPKGFNDTVSPFQMYSSTPQRVGNVCLVQGAYLPDNCVPCREEGCERHRQSRSKCLDGLGVSVVIEEVKKSLKERSASSEDLL
ncbi:MAG: glycosyltransferase family 9 protein, partial [Candidatus Thiodiazotropha sp. (ex Semelilucina semeliformis)]|nr:glycosyltransferase family 9 protein [Candidatus Thiodiazotropha sp. (ex Semelilucina semeliformis)]